MSTLTTIFDKGFLDKDSHPFAVQKGMMRELRNGQLIFSGDKYSISKAKGNVEVFDPSLANHSLYAAESFKKKIYLFYKENDGSRSYLYEYDVDSETSDLIYEGFQLIDPESTGIYGFDVVDDRYIYYIDGESYPKMIDKKKAMRGEYSIAEDFTTTAKPPTNFDDIEISLNYITGDEISFLDKSQFRFAYQYIYDDNRESVLSFFTAPAFDTYVGKNVDGYIRNIVKSVDITVNTGSYDVKEVVVVGVDGYSNTGYYIKRINKDTESLNDNQDYTFNFDNSNVYSVVPERIVDQYYDNTPRKPKTQTLVSNRLFYGNYEEGYDVIDKNYDTVTPDATVSFQDSIDSFINKATSTTNSPTQIDVDVDLSLTETVREIYFRVSITSSLGSDHDRWFYFRADQEYATVGDLFSNSSFESDADSFISDMSVSYDPTGKYVRFDLIDGTFKGDVEFFILTSSLSVEDKTKLTLNPSMSYDYAIAYYDSYKRLVGVLYDIDTSTFPSKDYDNKYHSVVRINHLPPKDASIFRILRKNPNNRSYIGGFNAYTDGTFIYLKPLEGYKGLVQEGTILTHIPNSARDEEWSVRVMDIESKGTDFLGGSGDYIKIQDPGKDGFSISDVYSEWGSRYYDKFMAESKDLPDEYSFYSEIPKTFSILSNGHEGTSENQDVQFISDVTSVSSFDYSVDYVVKYSDSLPIYTLAEVGETALVLDEKKIYELQASVRPVWNTIDDLTAYSNDKYISWGAINYRYNNVAQDFTKVLSSDIDVEYTVLDESYLDDISSPTSGQDALSIKDKKIFTFGGVSWSETDLSFYGDDLIISDVSTTKYYRYYKNEVVLFDGTYVSFSPSHIDLEYIDGDSFLIRHTESEQTSEQSPAGYIYGVTHSNEVTFDMTSINYSVLSKINLYIVAEPIPWGTIEALSFEYDPSNVYSSATTFLTNSSFVSELNSILNFGTAVKSGTNLVVTLDEGHLFYGAQPRMNYYETSTPNVELQLYTYNKEIDTAKDFINTYRYYSEIIDFKKTYRYSSIIYTGVYEDSTSYNGLGNFDFNQFNYKDYPKKFGKIIRIENDADNIIMLQEHGIKVIPVSKDVVTSASEEAALTLSNNVLGEGTSYSTEYGLTNYSGYVDWQFRRYHVDLHKNAVLRLSRNGDAIISDVGIEDYITDLISSNRYRTIYKSVKYYFERYNQMIQEDVEDGDLAIVSGDDTIYSFSSGTWSINEDLTTLTEDKNIRVEISDSYYKWDYLLQRLVSTTAYNDIKTGFDPKKKRFLISIGDTVLSFKDSLESQRKGWVAEYDYTPDIWVNDGYDLYSVKDNKLYKHNYGNYNEFYGVNKELSVKFVVNDEPNMIKELLSIAIYKDPIDVRIYNEDQNYEVNIEEERFEDKKGKQYAYVSGNELENYRDFDIFPFGKLVEYNPALEPANLTADGFEATVVDKGDIIYNVTTGEDVAVIEAITSISTSSGVTTGVFRVSTIGSGSVDDKLALKKSQKIEGETMKANYWIVNMTDNSLNNKEIYMFESEVVESKV